MSLALGEAVSRVNILHGDISPANILVTKDGHGLLIDWELAVDIEQEDRYILNVGPFNCVRKIQR